MKLSEIFLDQMLCPTLSPRKRKAHTNKDQSQVAFHLERKEEMEVGQPADIPFEIKVCMALLSQFLLMMVGAIVPIVSTRWAHRLFTNYPEVYLAPLSFSSIVLLIYGFNTGPIIMDTQLIVIVSLLSPIIISSMMVWCDIVYVLVCIMMMVCSMIGYIVSMMCVMGRGRLVSSSVWSIVMMIVVLMILVTNNVVRLKDVKIWICVVCMLLCVGLCGFVHYIISIFSRSQSVNTAVLRFYTAPFHLVISILVWVSTIWA